MLLQEVELAEVELAEYPKEITERFHGSPEQSAVALVGERPARWDHIVIEDYDPAWVGRQVAWLGRHLGVEGRSGERLNGATARPSLYRCARIFSVC